jgi:chloramphenicol 3-O phosphotransferase
MATVFLLNGGGSTGKSTLAMALQERAEGILLHVSVDDILSLVPRRLNGFICDTRDGFWFERNDQAGADELVELHWGRAGSNVMSAMFRARSCYADVGYDVVIDHVLLFREWVDELARDLWAHRVIFVGVFCSSGEELERRERQRGDRPIGIARWLSTAAHLHGVPYDLSVDTAVLSTQFCAEAILAVADRLRREDTSCYRIAREGSHGRGD